MALDVMLPVSVSLLLQLHHLLVLGFGFLMLRPWSVPVGVAILSGCPFCFRVGGISAIVPPGCISDPDFVSDAEPLLALQQRDFERVLIHWQV